MNSGVSVLIPTRKRPKRLDECVGSIKKNAKGPVEVLTYVDDDDDSYKEWTVKGPRFERAKMFRSLMGHAQYPFLMICGDDTRFETHGWDEIMSAKIPPDGIGLVFGFDGWKNVAGHFLLTKRFIELTGGFPDEFEHFGIDTYISDVMRGVERFFQVDVMIRHLHHRNGLAEQDDTYRHPRDSMMNQRDRDRLGHFRKHRMQKDIDILKAEIERFSSVGRADAAVGAPPRDEQTRSV